MIEVISITLTYCHRCKKPTKCGEIEFDSWEYRMHICSNFLMEFIRKIDITSNKKEGLN